MHPPDHAIVVSLDDKTSTEPLQQTQPYLPIAAPRCLHARLESQPNTVEVDEASQGHHQEPQMPRCSYLDGGALAGSTRPPPLGGVDDVTFGIWSGPIGPARCHPTSSSQRLGASSPRAAEKNNLAVEYGSTQFRGSRTPR